ncbi:MAG TPA: hypothetical protein VFI13_08025 [Gemmatimonadales bacterium]|nr:hypothetical protein [Gemmatimonadales bacterium]
MAEAERFEVPRARRVIQAVAGAVMLSLGLTFTAFIYFGLTSAQDPAAARIGFALIAATFGLVGALIVRDARNEWGRAYTLRDGGIELAEGDGTPNFISWGQIGSVRLRQARGGMGVLGLDGTRLFSVDARLPGATRLVQAILVNAVFPKRATLLPYAARRTAAGAWLLLPIVVIGGLAVAVVTSAAPEAQGPVLISFAAIALAVVGVAWLLDRFTQVRSVTIDASGITVEKGGRSTLRPWSELAGAALVLVPGDKGALFPRAGLQGQDGKWTALNLSGVDPVDLLAAINTAAPAKMIAPPDRPIGLSSRVSFTARTNTTFRIGPRRPTSPNDPT